MPTRTFFAACNRARLPSPLCARAGPAIAPTATPPAICITCRLVTAIAARRSVIGAVVPLPHRPIGRLGVFRRMGWALAGRQALDLGIAARPEEARHGIAVNVVGVD